MQLGEVSRLEVLTWFEESGWKLEIGPILRSFIVSGDIDSLLSFNFPKGGGISFGTMPRYRFRSELGTWVGESGRLAVLEFVDARIPLRLPDVLAGSIRAKETELHQMIMKISNYRFKQRSYRPSRYRGDPDDSEYEEESESELARYIGEPEFNEFLNDFLDRHGW